MKLHYEQQIKALLERAARDRDRDGDWDGRWQILVDALAAAYEAARELPDSE